jgi:hypothetical protein
MENPRAQEKINVLITRFFSAFDNRNGVIPLLPDLLECFADKATVARHSIAGAELYTVREFATPRIELLTKGGLQNFHEWEVSPETQIFGGIATRTSRYGKSGLLNGKDYSGSGTKCFHLVECSLGWRIASLAWVDDNV